MLLRSLTWAAILILGIAAPCSADGDAALIDQSGHHLSFASLRGMPLVVTFVSARCQTACPLIEAQIARAVDAIGERPVAVRFLTLTLDPQHDTVAQIRALSKRFAAQPARWIFATGSDASIRALMRRFGVTSVHDAHNTDDAHSTLVYVLDSHLRLERTLLPSDDLASQLLSGIEQ